MFQVDGLSVSQTTITREEAVNISLAETLKVAVVVVVVTVVAVVVVEVKEKELVVKFGS